jgi:hypothetical protein
MSHAPPTGDKEKKPQPDTAHAPLPTGAPVPKTDPYSAPISLPIQWAGGNPFSNGFGYLSPKSGFMAVGAIGIGLGILYQAMNPELN